ncbi:uncharacterized protein LOC126844193 isoform X2 [Adelges cooleyi]|uniref:uncharacterized protein LOC126844193 isoform X2 n=1 Tax=Adelges cooleyi TaxID=133065 RepID=UPI00217FE835|nr:uncharacterized protein LOC126844193 isoform X2 [Adelges cooleyi]
MALKLCKGGSQITFSDDVRCCVPLCGATRDGNRSLPFYTFPSDVTLCKEWVDEIQLPIEGLQNLHITHKVCSKHFTLFKGGMRLNVRSSIIQNTDNTESNQKTNSTGTQTYDEHWIKNLKESGVDIICDNYTQCRLCASCSVQMLSIYNKRNQNLKLETLVNKLLPIQVNPKDSKPLTICVQCVLKLEQFDDLFIRCSQNDKSFERSRVNVSETHQSVICKAQKQHIPTNNNNSNDCDQIVPHNITDEYSPMGTNKLTLDFNTANPSDFIKMESRMHKIKILIADKQYINAHAVPIPHQRSSNNNKIIEVEFKADYILCHGREWVHGIHVDVKQLEYTQETIDQILQVIKVTMKKQCAETNSKMTPLPISSSSLERCISRQANNMRTESVIIDAKKQINDEIKKKAAEMLMKKEPLKRGWICKKCGLKLETRQSFIAHTRFNHPRPCRYCGEHITPRDQLCLHEKEHRKPTTDGFICHLCGRQFKTLRSLNIHYSQHKNRERFCCTICNLEFTNGFGLRKHLRQHHKELLVKKNPDDVLRKRQKCNKCNLWLSSPLALRVHIKTHLPIEERMKTCPKCNKAFINASSSSCSF